MKKLIKLCLCLVLAPIFLNAQEKEFESLAGTYVANVPGYPVQNQLTLTEKGEVYFYEFAQGGQLYCAGGAFVDENKQLVLQMNCENGTQYLYVVTLSGVTDFLAFQTTVYSSLYNLYMQMNFVKVLEPAAADNTKDSGSSKGN